MNVMNGAKVKLPYKKLDPSVRKSDFVDRRYLLTDNEKDRRINALELALIEIMVDADSVLSSDHCAPDVTRHKLQSIANLSSIMIGANKNKDQVPVVYALGLVNIVEKLFTQENSDENISDRSGGKE